MLVKIDGFVAEGNSIRLAPYCTMHMADGERFVSDTICVTDGVYVTDIPTAEFAEKTGVVPDNTARQYFGVCDNAEQVLRFYEKLRATQKIRVGRNDLILLTPIFRSSQPVRTLPEIPEFGVEEYTPVKVPEDLGWKWAGHGLYIGIQKPQKEYLTDEDIDVVFEFRIMPVKEQQKGAANV